MTLHPRLTKAGIELVQRFEGLRRKAARLDNGGWTIGYGHTLSAREGAEVTAEEAAALLLYDLDRVAKALDSLTFTALNPNQFSALVAFAFNIGLENFKTSAVLARVNEGAFLKAAAAIELWRRADYNGDSLVVDALVRRRAAEKALFLTPLDGSRVASTPVVRAAHDETGSELSYAAELWVPLDGPSATAERYDSPGAATTAAVANVTARLQELIPDVPAHAGLDVLTETPSAPTAVEPDPQPEAEPEAAPEPEAVPESEAAPEPEPPAAFEPEPNVASEPEPAPELVLEPPPVDDVEPAPEVPAPPPVEEEPPPPPSLFDPTTRLYSDEETRFEASKDEFGHRSIAYSTDIDAIFAKAAPARPVSPSLHAPVALLVGLFGAVMFVGALVAMVYGKATLTNLVIGLLGVVCMAPAGLKLLLKLFDGRSDED